MSCGRRGMSNSGRIPPLNVHRRGTLGAPLVAAQTWTCSRLKAFYVRSLNSGGFERITLGGERLRTCCNRLADSLVGRRIPPLARRQRKTKDDDGTFKGMVAIQPLAEDAGLSFDRVPRQAGGD